MAGALTGESEQPRGRRWWRVVGAATGESEQPTGTAVVARARKMAGQSRICGIGTRATSQQRGGVGAATTLWEQRRRLEGSWPHNSLDFLHPCPTTEQ
jgi:hypothetical protein